MSRVATTTMYSRSTSYLQNLNTKLDKASEQYNTGKKFQTASESPANYAASMRLQNDIAMYEQYDTNAGYALDNLSLEETSLSSANSRLDRAKVLLQEGVNGSYSQDEYNAIASELEEIQKYLLDVMNTKTSEGEYIFSGTMSNTEPFVVGSDGTVSYKGDNGQRYIQASSSVNIAVSDSGLSVFQNVATGTDGESPDNIYNTLSKAIKALKNNDTDLNTILAEVQDGVGNAQTAINTALGKIGARQNSLESVIEANDEISDAKQEANATISEVDLYEASSNLLQIQNNLQLSMKSFNYVTGTSLFDYIS